MQLVGARDEFIRRPFLIEGVVTGALGGLLAVAMTTNYVSGTPVGDLRMLGIGTAAVRSAESRRVD